MPRRTALLDDYYVHDPNVPVSDEGLSYVNSSGRTIKKRPVIIWHGGCRREFGRVTPGKECTAILSASEFFEQYQPIQVFFSVLCGRSDSRYGYLQNVIDVTTDDYLRRINAAITEQVPLLWPHDNGKKSLHLFGARIWEATAAESALTLDELRLVFLESVDAERRRFEKLRARFDGLGGAPTGRKRAPIPEEVRMFVWRRDEGRCVKCGSQESLEFDHIIPGAKVAAIRLGTSSFFANPVIDKKVTIFNEGPPLLAGTTSISECVAVAKVCHSSRRVVVELKDTSKNQSHPALPCDEPMRYNGIADA